MYAFINRQLKNLTMQNRSYGPFRITDRHERAQLIIQSQPTAHRFACKQKTCINLKIY